MDPSAVILAALDTLELSRSWKKQAANWKTLDMPAVNPEALEFLGLLEELELPSGQGAVGEEPWICPRPRRGA